MYKVAPMIFIAVSQCAPIMCIMTVSGCVTGSTRRVQTSAEE